MNRANPILLMRRPGLNGPVFQNANGKLWVKAMNSWRQGVASGIGPGAGLDNLLLGDGDDLLLESGDALLLE